MNLNLNEIDYIINILAGSVSYCAMNDPEKLDLVVELLKKFSNFRRSKLNNE